MESDRDWSAADAAPHDPLWAVYARLSLEDEAQQGVDRQISDTTRDARHRGAKRIRVYADRGFSASKRRVIRPQFEELLADLEAGFVSYVVAWRAERLARQPRDAERLMDALGADETPPRAIAYTVADSVDSSTDAGAFIFRQLVQFGKWESKAIGQRVARAQKSRMESGRFSGSPPAFGHRDGTGWREIEPAEAVLLQEGAARVVAGEGIRSILRDFNQRGARTRRGSGWQHRAFIKTLTSPRMIGARMVGDTVNTGTDETGTPWIAPILDRETWDQVRRILLDPARRPLNPGGTPKHLLTGLMRCAVCLGPLRAKGNSGKAHGAGYWTYGCIKDAYHLTACGRVWIKGAPTDSYIENIVLSHLRMPGVVSALTHGTAGVEPGAEGEEADLRRQAFESRERIIAVEAASLRGPQALELEFGVSVAAYRSWRPGALADLDELERRLGRYARARTVVRAIADPSRFWEEASLDERRATVRAVLPDITVLQAAAVADPPPRRWDARRIRWTAVG